METEQPQKPTQTSTPQSEVDLSRANSKPVGKATQAQTAGTSQKPIPDQATIDALLQVARVEQERREAVHGTPMNHWWNPLEWVSASAAMRKSGLIKLAFFIVATIILTVLTNYVVSHAGGK